jgi:uncharacterized protein
LDLKSDYVIEQTDAKDKMYFYEHKMLLVKTELNVSRIHGIGLFAGEFICEGTIIWRFNPVIDLRFSEEQINQLPQSSREQIKKYSYREKHSRLYVLCGDDARFFNHSDNPNCTDVFYNEEEDLTFANSDIHSGEELTCNYALFDLDLIEGKYSIPLNGSKPTFITV